MSPDLGKMLLIAGAAMLVLGFIFTFFSGTSGLPKLPGDIYIKRGNSTFYFPIVTSILLSIILSIILNFFLRK